MSIPYPNPLLPLILRETRATEYIAQRTVSAGYTRIIDFANPSIDMSFISIEGDYESYSIVTYDKLGIPKPEDMHSGQGLTIKVKPGGTVYIMCSALVPPFNPAVMYTVLYSIEDNVNVVVYPVLGWNLNQKRQLLPKKLTLPKGSWGRYVTTWFGEAHHGETVLVIEITNPSTSSVNVVIGCIVVACITYGVAGHMMIYGWEDTYELDLNNETLSFNIQLFLPTPVTTPVKVTIHADIVGDGTNPLSITVKEANTGAVIISGSNSSTTPISIEKSFNVLLTSSNPAQFESVLLSVTLSTQGSGKLLSLWVAIKGMYTESVSYRTVTKAVGGGATVTISPPNSPLSHFIFMKMVLTAPTDGAVDVIIGTPLGEELIKTVPPSQTETIEVFVRHRYVKITNYGSSPITVDISYIYSNSLLI